MHTRMGNKTEDDLEGPYRLFHRHSQAYYEEHETVEDALRSQYWGEEGGHIYATKVVDANGEVVYDHERDTNIFDFCEDAGYDWIDPMI